MTTPNFAKIERVDLREAWPNEARDFTPWLAENIAELGEALGMDLELQQTEASVGGYSLDVLATDEDQNRPVIIENQLEPTNHDHLGKLLTYAAGYDANVIVWLAREFRDEHRQALDWLNQRTSEDTHFFGVEVELWQIGDSLPAPHFKVVATPNGWRKRQVRSTSSSDRDEKNYEWRTALIESLRSDHGLSLRSRSGEDIKARHLTLERRPVPEIPDVRYRAIWPQGSLGIELMARKPGIDGRDWNQRLFDYLERNRQDIETGILEAGQPERLYWQSTEDRQTRSSVVVFRDGNVFDGPELWEEHRKWIAAKFRLFQVVLTPYLREFVAKEQTTLD